MATVPTSELLRAAAADIEQLESTVSDLEAKLRVTLVQQAQDLRLMYRRGYFAGHAAGRNGRALETAPERHARSSTRRELGDD
jgi:hypothetical protein